MQFLRQQTDILVGWETDGNEKGFDNDKRTFGQLAGIIQMDARRSPEQWRDFGSIQDIDLFHSSTAQRIDPHRSVSRNLLILAMSVPIDRSHLLY